MRDYSIEDSFFQRDNVAVRPVVSYFLCRRAYIFQLIFGKAVSLIEHDMILLCGDIFSQTMPGKSNGSQCLRREEAAVLLKNLLKGRNCDTRQKRGIAGCQFCIRIPSKETVFGGMPETGQPDDADDGVCAGKEYRLACAGNLHRKPPGTVAFAENPLRNIPDAVQKSARKRGPFCRDCSRNRTPQRHETGSAKGGENLLPAFF